MAKLTMFFGWIWLTTMIAGGFMTSSTPTVSTVLTANLTSVATTVTVKSTTGFPNTGVVVIGGEKIWYASKTATTFKSNPAHTLERGYGTTGAASHGIGSGVRSQEGALINNVLDLKLANIADSAGIMKFFAGMDFVFTMLATFFTAPLTFLGTDLAIISYVWGICAAGFIVFLILTVTGGRRV